MSQSEKEILLKYPGLCRKRQAAKQNELVCLYMDCKTDCAGNSFLQLIFYILVQSFDVLLFCIADNLGRIFDDLIEILEYRREVLLSERRLPFFPSLHA